MPKTDVLLFAESNGSAPLIEWLDGLPSKVQDKCIVRIERLKRLGHELRRPEADYLRDGIYELRICHRNIHYRVLYFFNKRKAVLSHGLVKERDVPDREINLAIKRKLRYSENPQVHAAQLD